MNAALTQLRAQGYPVADADVVRLSPVVHRHTNGSCTFAVVELPQGLRVLRDLDAHPEDDD